MDLSALLLGLGLGLKHGVEPAHLAAIDGIARLYPSRWNGVLFGLGHAVVVTALALSAGRVDLHWLAPLAPWLLIALGLVNLWQLFRSHRPRTGSARLGTLTLAVGAIFAAGFEAASIMSAFLLTDRQHLLTLALVYSLGMLLVGGVDGYLAAQTQQHALAGSDRAIRASRLLGVVVVLASFGLAARQLTAGSHPHDHPAWQLPLGIGLVLLVIAIRVSATWPSKSEPGETPLPSVTMASITGEHVVPSSDEVPSEATVP